MLKNKSDVQRMLGEVNYCGKYVPRLSGRTASMRALVKPLSWLVWTENHMSEWKSVVQILSTTPVLAIFDPRKESQVNLRRFCNVKTANGAQWHMHPVW